MTGAHQCPRSGQRGAGGLGASPLPVRVRVRGRGPRSPGCPPRGKQVEVEPRWGRRTAAPPPPTIPTRTRPGGVAFSRASCRPKRRKGKERSRTTGHCSIIIILRFAFFHSHVLSSLLVDWREPPHAAPERAEGFLLVLGSGTKRGAVRDSSRYPFRSCPHEAPSLLASPLPSFFLTKVQSSAGFKSVWLLRGGG